MARARTTKKLAQRIDLNYFKRPTPLKRAKFWLSLLLPLLALSWIVDKSLSRDSRVYSSGNLSQAHAILEKECAACHVRQAGEFSAKAADNACHDCHDGPAHHPSQVPAPDCSTCHTEHRGRVNLSSASEEACAECHAPEFAALRSVAGVAAGDPGTIKLNHAIHLKPIQRGANGPVVNLECGNCHRPAAANVDLTYSDAKYRAAAVSYKDTEEFLSIRMESLKPPKPVSGRELMAPVKFANACAACHLLTFDKRFDEDVPHDKPAVVHAFLIKKFQQYVAAHPGEVRVQRNPSRELTGKTPPSQFRVLTPAQWVTERTADAEELLWRKTCKQCHALTVPIRGLQYKIEAAFAQAGEAERLPPSLAELPNVAPANITLQWMPHAKFDHDAHRGFTCLSCHAKALASTEPSDILLPGIATCRTCHAPGPAHAESRCSECHTYHDWSKRKEVTPKFTPPALQNGER